MKNHKCKTKENVVYLPADFLTKYSNCKCKHNADGYQYGKSKLWYIIKYKLVGLYFKIKMLSL